MKRMFLLGVTIVAVALPIRAQYTVDSIDPGVPDTFHLALASLEFSGGDTAILCVELSYSFDSCSIAGLSMSYKWVDSTLRLDSAKIPSEVSEAFDLFQFVYYKNSLDSSNANKSITFGGMRVKSKGLQKSVGRYVLCRYFFSVPNWSRTKSVTIFERTFYLGPGRRASGYLESVPGRYFGIFPQWSGPFVIHDPNRPCCVNIMGSIDGQDRKLPCQADSSKVEFSCNCCSRKMAGGSPFSASCGRFSL